jgi:hypothetical protein
MCRSTNAVHVVMMSHQASSITRLPPINRPILTTKKTVRFDDNKLDQVRYFERISCIDAMDVWFNESELHSILQEGKKLALAYRNLTNNNNSNIEHQYRNLNYMHQDYRGFGHYTRRRQRHRLLSNRFNVLIHRQKDIIMNDDRTQLDDISQRCSDWSTNVALLTAINDYFESYGGDEETVQLFFPSVTDMIPPEFPIAIQRVMLLSSNNKQRKRTGIQRSVISNNVIRRVKQRVVY